MPPPWFRGATGALSRVAPPLAARLAERVFLTVPARPLKPAERTHADAAHRVAFDTPSGPIQGWRWGDAPETVLLVHGWGGRGPQLSAIAHAMVGARLLGADVGHARPRRAPAPDQPAGAGPRDRRGRAVGISWDEFEAATLAPSLGVPALLIHDREDERVPFDHAVELSGYLSAELVPTSGLGHSAILSDPAVLARVAEFFPPAAARPGLR